MLGQGLPAKGWGWEIKQLTLHKRLLWVPVQFSSVVQSCPTPRPHPISNPGPTTLVRCVILGKFADLSVSDSPFCTIEMMAEHPGEETGSFREMIRTKQSELGLR